MAVISVDELKGIIGNRNGIAKGNRFRFEAPGLGPLGVTDDTRELSFLCRRVSMPGKQILSADRRVGATFQKVAYGYAVEDVNVSFLLTGDLFAKDVFENWQQIVMDTAPGSTLHAPAYKNEYSTNVNVVALDKDGNDVYKVTLEKAYPTTVNATEFSDDNEGVLQLDVQLSYMRWFKEFV